MADEDVSVSPINHDLIAKFNKYQPLIDPIMDPIAYADAYTPLDMAETLLDYLGLMRGSTAPLKRFVFGFLATTTALYLAEPTLTHLNGLPRGWKLINDNPDSTYVPWYLISFVIGSTLGLFI